MTRAYRALCLLLAFAFLVASVTSPLFAQSTEAGIIARLKNKPLYIRGFWSDDSLNFDGDGDLTKPSQRSPFSVNGFSFRSLELKNGFLKLSGGPMGTEFRKDGPKCVNLPGNKRTITITAPPDGDFGPALDAIFADGLKALAPTMPAYWQAWARKTYPEAFPAGITAPPDKGADHGTDGSTSESPPVSKVGGSVLRPQIVKPSYATFTQEAKDLRYSGTTVIHLIVEADGRPSQIEVGRPLGLGLDERALTSVGQNQFSPATQAGRPVRAEADIEVNFQIF